MSDATRTASVTLVAYGSLMSGLGLTGLAPLPAADAWRVRLRECRRGLGKLSQYGDRLAMVLEPLHDGVPIGAERVGPDTPTDADGLALEVSIEDLARVAAREGYPAAAVTALAGASARAGVELAAWLWQQAEAAGHDRARYRRALLAATGATSPHYVPHPVALDAGAFGVVFLPPGREGTGSDAVVPIRVLTSMEQVLTVRDAWRVKPTRSQLDYLASCLLAEVHNLSLADVVGDLAAYPALAGAVRARLAIDAPAEPARFQAALGLDAARYAARFPPTPRRASFLA